MGLSRREFRLFEIFDDKDRDKMQDEISDLLSAGLTLDSIVRTEKKTSPDNKSYIEYQAIFIG